MSYGYVVRVTLQTGRALPGMHDYKTLQGARNYAARAVRKHPKCTVTVVNLDTGERIDYAR